MSTPPTATPRTDAAWKASFSPERANFSVRDECEKLETELTAACSLQALACQKLDAAETEIARLRSEVERLKGLASWANTCIHHNDAERARYGHVCLVCTSTRAEKAEKLWKEFITLMDITEESDSGYKFNPNKISSCRAMDGKRLNEILNEARQIVFDTPKE